MILCIQTPVSTRIILGIQTSLCMRIILAIETLLSVLIVGRLHWKYGVSILVDYNGYKAALTLL